MYAYRINHFMKNFYLKVINFILIVALYFISNAAFAQRKIILKLDDFSVKNSICPAAPVLDYLVQKRVKAGIGFIAQRLDATAISTMAKYMNATNGTGQPLFEVWHHGLDHIKPEFKETGYAYQKEHFDGATQMIKELLRVQMRSFGSPYNANDTNTNKVIAEDANYKVTMFNKPAAPASTGILNLNNRVNMETTTGQVDYNAFVTNYNTYKNTYTDLMVLQGHPHMWTTTLLDQFKQVIDFLLAEGCEFVTPYEYYCSLYPSTKLATKKQTITFNTLPVKKISDKDFSAGATASSGLPILYNISDLSVVSIVNGKIHIEGAGTAIITASQIGDMSFKPAPYVSQTITISR